MLKRLGRGSVRFLCVSVLFTANLRGGESSGWRTDGTGQYPTAQPPTVWAPDKGMVWKTPLPASSNASPILVGNRIFICAEPDTLLCVDAADGKIMWQKPAHGYDEVMTPAQAAAAQAEEPKAAAIRKQLTPLKEERNELLSKQRHALAKELEELDAQLNQKPEDAALKWSLVEKRMQQAALKQSIDEKNVPIEKLEQELDEVSAWRLLSPHKTNGYASPTPVSDGRNVCVFFGTGVAACYDLEGNRQWIKLVEKSVDPEGYGLSASPLLCGHKLLVHVFGQRPNSDTRWSNLTALNAASGEVVWKANVAQSFKTYGSAVLANVGGADVAVMPGGELVRVNDGKVLATGLGSLAYCAPVVQDGVVYFTNESKLGGKAVLLPASIAEPFKVEHLWNIQLRGGDRYYASPVVCGGLVYALSYNVSSHNNTLIVLEAETGNVVYEQQKVLFEGGPCYTSLALAGKYLFASSEKGVTVVFEPGRTYKEIARNTLEPFLRSTPIFSGRRMYVRTSLNLYCIGE